MDPNPQLEDASRMVFRQLQPICVPLLGNSKLTPRSIPEVSRLLFDILKILRTLPGGTNALTSNLIEYIFFPLSSIFQRNPLIDIPAPILESLFNITAVLAERWWWDCSMAIWEQLMMLSSFVLAGMDEKKTKGKERDRPPEAKEAAASVVFALVRSRTPNEVPPGHMGIPEERHQSIINYATESSRFPLIGRALDAALDCTTMDNVAFRLLSFSIVNVLVEDFFPESRIPAILPGLVSRSCKVALGLQISRGWESADVITEALGAMGTCIIKSIGDEVCLSAGLIRKTPVSLQDLEGLMVPLSESTLKLGQNTDPYAFQRTPGWLQGTAPQIHMAIMSLTPLLLHHSPSAHLSFANLCARLLQQASLTLPTLHQFLLSHLLTLSLSSFPKIQTTAESSLISVFSSSSGLTLSRTLLQLLQQNLVTLPSLILAHSDLKVQNAARQIEAACRLSSHPSLAFMATEVGFLLGPGGDIAKWGSGLLRVLEIELPATFSTTTPDTRLIVDALEVKHGIQHPFPELRLRHATAPETQIGLQKMFHSLGRSAGKEALFTVEWFTDLAGRGRSSEQVSALFCAVRVFEGINGLELPSTSYTMTEGPPPNHSRAARKLIEKIAKSVSRSVSDFWDVDRSSGQGDSNGEKNNSDQAGLLTLLDDTMLPTEYVKGLNPVTTLLDGRGGTFGRGSRSEQSKANHDLQMTVIHRVLSLQLLGVSASVLGSQFSPLLLYALYPVLRSLVSSHSILSATAMAALHHISSAAGYATPANMLLSNFDYALDSISRRLLRSRLDVRAPKALVLLVRLVGKDVVKRAGDVVEECFDRLDEFHGYSHIVDGLVEVMNEVVKVVQREDAEPAEGLITFESRVDKGKGDLSRFVEWFKHRKDGFEIEREDFGPAPRRSWGRDGTSDEGLDQDGQDDGTTKHSPTQELVSRIIQRCLPFLTHASPTIRARILSLMQSSVAVVPSDQMLPVIHKSWPYVLNRLKDTQPYVVVEAASLIETLAAHAGDFMSSRIIEDVWPAYQKMLKSLDEGDRTNALASRRRDAVGTTTQYSTSHRLYLAILNTMTSVFTSVKGGNWIKDELTWDASVSCRRFLSKTAHPRLQQSARMLYRGLARHNDDLVWLVLTSTTTQRTATGGQDIALLPFLRDDRWDIEANVQAVLGDM